MSEDVTNWLQGLGLGLYAKAFEEGAIDWEVLPSLDHEILKELAAFAHRFWDWRQNLSQSEMISS